MDIRSSAHTRFNSGSLATARIDRSFVLATGSQLTVANIPGGVLRAPVDWYTGRLSDDAPLFYRIVFHNCSREVPRRILHYVRKRLRCNQLITRNLEPAQVGTLDIEQSMAVTQIVSITLRTSFRLSSKRPKTRTAIYMCFSSS